MKIILASSERFSGSIIAALERRGHRVVGVVSPARGIYNSRFRGWRNWFYELRQWDVIKRCRKGGIEFRVCRRLDEGSLISFIKNAKPDLLLLFGWPNLVGERTLSLFPFGGMNIHPSLLPLGRGPDPLFSLIDSGQSGFGISYHRVVGELDAGPLYFQSPLIRLSRDTYDRLYFRLIEGIHHGINRAVDSLLRNPEGVPQRGEPSYVGRFRKSHRFLDPARPLDAEIRRTRACYSHHSRISACNGVLFYFSTAREEVAFDPVCDRHAAIQQRGGFSLILRWGGRYLQLGGIRFYGKPRWMTPFLLAIHCRPGAVLESRARVRELWRSARTAAINA